MSCREEPGRTKITNVLFPHGHCSSKFQAIDSFLSAQSLSTDHTTNSSHPPTRFSRIKNILVISENIAIFVTVNQLTNLPSIHSIHYQILIQCYKHHAAINRHLQLRG